MLIDVLFLNGFRHCWIQGFEVSERCDFHHPGVETTSTAVRLSVILSLQGPSLKVIAGGFRLDENGFYFSRVLPEVLNMSLTGFMESVSSSELIAVSRRAGDIHWPGHRPIVREGRWGQLWTNHVDLKGDTDMLLPAEEEINAEQATRNCVYYIGINTS